MDMLSEMASAFSHRTALGDRTVFWLYEHRDEAERAGATTPAGFGTGRRVWSAQSTLPLHAELQYGVLTC